MTFKHDNNFGTEGVVRSTIRRANFVLRAFEKDWFVLSIFGMVFLRLLWVKEGERERERESWFWPPITYVSLLRFFRWQFVWFGFVDQSTQFPIQSEDKHPKLCRVTSVHSGATYLIQKWGNHRIQADLSSIQHQHWTPCRIVVDSSQITWTGLIWDIYMYF